MTREDYCSFELSKLLKEKGFDGECVGCYWDSKKIFDINYEPLSYSDGDLRDEVILAPTHQMAMKWLREEHKIDIFIDTDFPIDRMKYTYKIVRIYKDGDKYTDVMGGSFNTYEEAVEAALEYVLEKFEITQPERAH